MVKQSVVLPEIEDGDPPIRKRSVKRRLKDRYDTHMPDRWHHRLMVWVAFFVCSGMIGIQLLYPPDRALPFTKIAQTNTTWQTHDQLAELVNQSFQDTRLNLIVDSALRTEVPLATAGAEPNTEAMVKQLMDYPFWQRFIPFSLFMHTATLKTADVYYTVSVLQATSEEQAAKLTAEPLNARLAIENGVLVATAEQRGSEVRASSVYEAITNARPTLGAATDVFVSAARVSPSETSKSLESVRGAAEDALSRRVTIEVDGHRFMPDNETIASWLEIAVGDDRQATLRIADDQLNHYFDMIDKEVGTPAGQTNINLTNGRETSREAGKNGLAVDRESVKDRIGEWLLNGTGNAEVAAALKEVPPSVIYDNKYTATEEGLRTYVADASKRMNVHIAIQQLDGGKWTASARADESIPSASTYKLFVAKWLFDQMDKGLVHWDDPMLDTTVSVCFDRMTIASTNPCAESWLAKAGRSNFNEYIYGLGFSRGTSFTMPDATHTTANDLQRMMLGINDGSIMSGAHKDRLLRSLSTHPYRYGIPTGSGGQVWDKVGFLWDYVHDTAIVKHPKGTYVMTIMTKGQSYATIANLTREIERIMYP